MFYCSNCLKALNQQTMVTRQVGYKNRHAVYYCDLKCSREAALKKAEKLRVRNLFRRQNKIKG